jgi:hypothetical protein
MSPRPAGLLTTLLISALAAIAAFSSIAGAEGSGTTAGASGVTAPVTAEHTPPPDP